MELNEFLEKYVPQIGNRVKDEYFNTQRLTKTAILNKAIEIFFVPTFKKAYIERNYKNIVYYLSKVTMMAKELGIPSKYYDMGWDGYYLPYSIGNDKIGNDTLCISVNTALLCYMGITGNCENCNICYAKSSNKMYSSEFVKNNISQYVFIVGDTLKLAVNTVKQIKKDLSKNKIKNLKFLRFNVNGDLLDDMQLKKLDEIAGILKKELNLYVAYTYTHNRDLNQSIAKNIVINSSFEDSGKSCITIFELGDKYLDKSKYVICNGNCHKCSYCKDKEDKRTVLFLAHGNGLKGVKQLPEELRIQLDVQKAFDYMNFCERIEGGI